LSGYRVIFVPFADGKPSGPPVVVLNGFSTRTNMRVVVLSASCGQNGSLLVADDVGNAVWR
jgi:glucose/arabinose dehydrogenase